MAKSVFGGEGRCLRSKRLRQERYLSPPSESSGQLFDRSIFFVPAENPRGATAFTEVAADPPTSEIEFTRLWNLYFLTLVGQAFASHDITNDDVRIVQRELTAAGLLPKTASLRDRLAAVMQFVRSWM